MVSIRRLFGRGGDEDADQQVAADDRGANPVTQNNLNTPNNPTLTSAPAPETGETGPGDPALDVASVPSPDAPTGEVDPGVSSGGDSTPEAATDDGPAMADTSPIAADSGPAPETEAPPAPATDPTVETMENAVVAAPSEPTADSVHAPDPTLPHDASPPAGEPVEPAPAAESAPSPAEETPSWLVAGSTVSNRYTVVRELTLDSATDVLGSPPPISNATLYAVDDRMGYERCWSCGSTNNDQNKRFCVDCGAPQHREAVLARTLSPTGVAGEFAEGGSYFHVVNPRKQFGSAGISLEVGAYSAEGPHHPNEDSYWSGLSGGCYDSRAETAGVMVLADGMGGYAPGSGLISKSIVTTVGRGVFDLLNADPNVTKDEASLHAIVKGAIAAANGKVLDEIKIHGDMGATLVVVIIFGQTAFVANIGDSRAYYVSSSGTVEQITRDQSLVEQQVAAGQLSPDAVYTAIGNNVILHAVGEESVEDVVDWYTQPLEPGSHVMLCSDGYWKTMQHSVWDVEAAAAQPTLRGLARTMVENALANNTDDNTTVLLIGVD